MVGIGYLGKFHAQKYAAIPEARMVGLVDLVPEKAREWAHKLGTEAFPSYRSLLGKVDAVSVVVPTDQHHAVAGEFLRAGCDVLVEKPISSTLREAEDLIAAAREHGRILQVGHVERFNPVILAAGERIEVPLFVECHRLTRFRGRGTEVDVVMDLMIHDLDLILSFVRSPVRKVHAVGAPVLTGKVDIADARLEFEGGCVANLTASRVSFEDRRRLRVFQPDTCLTLDFASREASLFRPAMSGESGTLEVSGEKIEVPPGDALESEIRSFLHSCRTRTCPVVSGEDGRDALALAVRINAQIRRSLGKVPSVISFYRRKRSALETSAGGKRETCRAAKKES